MTILFPDILFHLHPVLWMVYEIGLTCLVTDPLMAVLACYCAWGRNGATSKTAKA